MPPSLSLAGAVDYWMTCRPLWFRPTPLIYGVPPIFANYSIGRHNLLNATHLLFLPIIPLAGAIYWMPQSTILLGRHNSSLNAVLPPISHLAGAVYWMPPPPMLYHFNKTASVLGSLWQQQALLPSYLSLLETLSWYIPIDCAIKRFNCWPAHFLPKPLKAHGIPDPGIPDPEWLSKEHITDRMGAIYTWMPSFVHVPRVVPLHISLSVMAISSSQYTGWLNWKNSALAKHYFNSSKPSSAQVVTSPWRIVSVIDFGCNSSDETKSDSAQ